MSLDSTTNHAGNDYQNPSRNEELAKALIRTFRKFKTNRNNGTIGAESTNQSTLEATASLGIAILGFPKG